MKFNFNLNGKLKRFCFILISLVILIFQTNFSYIEALPMEHYQGEMVIEELRLKVPANAKQYG